ncbi:hypothetical protein M0R72_05715 [Candidatus Pacearchaeota archaeon]|nr:hypothetical protein [Candidatus Pacearchaeota archaeon]
MDRSSAIAYVASMIVTTLVYLSIDQYKTNGSAKADTGKVVAYTLAGAFAAVSLYQMMNIWNSANGVNEMVSK